MNICQRLVFVRTSPVNLKQAFCCSHCPFSLPSTQSLAERILQQLLPSQPVICWAKLLQHSWRRKIENVPVRTNDPGGSQLAVGMRKALLDWQHPSLHPHFLPLLLLPTSFETDRLSQRDFIVEVWETRPPPSSSVHYVWPPTYHPPRTCPCPHLSVKERKTDNVCIASSVTTTGLCSFGIYELAI